MRYLVLLPILAASHGLVLALGLATRAKPVNVSVSEESSVKHEPQEKLKLEDFIVRTESEPEEQRPKETKESREEYQRKQEEEFAKLVAALPEDADLAAIVKAGAPDPEGGVTMESEVAFAAWLKRDPVAALHWRQEWSKGKRMSTSAFEKSFVHFIRTNTPQELNRAIVAAGEAGHRVLNAASFDAYWKGIDAKMALAQALSQKEDVEMVFMVPLLSTDGLARHLPAIRGMLSERRMAGFLSRVAQEEHAADLIAAVRSSGVPEEVAAEFEKGVAEAEEERRLEALPMVEKLQASGDDAEQWKRILEVGVPELDDWCRDFADSRMSADKVMAQLQAAVGGGAEMDGKLRDHLLPKLYEMNPVAAIDWARETMPAGEWQAKVAEAVSKGIYEVSPEILEKIAGTMSAGDFEASGMKSAATTHYDWWAGRDLKSAAAAARALPDGPLKEAAMAQVREEEGKR